jgi:hypothetical protein
LKLTKLFEHGDICDRCAYRLNPPAHRDDEHHEPYVGLGIVGLGFGGIRRNYGYSADERLFHILIKRFYSETKAIEVVEALCMQRQGLSYFRAKEFLDMFPDEIGK